MIKHYYKWLKSLGADVNLVKDTYYNIFVLQAIQRNKTLVR